MEPTFFWPVILFCLGNSCLQVFPTLGTGEQWYSTALHFIGKNKGYSPRNVETKKIVSNMVCVHTHHSETMLINNMKQHY